MVQSAPCMKPTSVRNGTSLTSASSNQPEANTILPPYLVLQSQYIQITKFKCVWCLRIDEFLAFECILAVPKFEYYLNW